MELWLQAARVAAAANLALLLALGSVWLRNYRSHGASHTLGLLVFAGFLAVENALWLYFYVLHDDFVGWFLASGTDVQVGVTFLCGLELAALLFLVRVTWR
ncbi:hypothetical protein G9464_12520 [Halostella sp. JP-L12]|uniref:hypothetical protein n=1 Tax=Halostella TaxID=1843185 RepID=UPI000EF82B72|nr:MULTISPECIES: hypothetical protein [Halostella]NHN48411.1 hypothetical protein [Halostella sp. JP-L12]